MDVVEACGGGEAPELFGLEAEPEIGLLIAEGLVLVRLVVEDADGAAGGRALGGSGEEGQGARGLGGDGGVVEDARGEDSVGAAGALARALDLGAVDLAADKLDVAEAAAADAIGGELELRLGAVEGDDVLEDGGDDLEERAVAGARVDGEAPVGEEGREGGEVGGELGRRAAPGGAAARGEELAGGGVAGGEDDVNAGEGSIGLAGEMAGAHGVRDDGVVRGVGGEAKEGPGTLLPGREEAGVAEGGGVAGNFGLTFVEKVGELADRELFGGGEGEEAEANRVREEPVKLAARVSRARVAGAPGAFRGGHEEAYMRSCEWMQEGSSGGISPLRKPGCQLNARTAFSSRCCSALLSSPTATTESRSGRNTASAAARTSSRVTRVSSSWRAIGVRAMSASAASP